VNSFFNLKINIFSLHIAIRVARFFFVQKTGKNVPKWPQAYQIAIKQ
jgi:hypothetical protein